MRKNILFIVICFITMFMFSDRVMGEDVSGENIDHTLNYDIEYFNVMADFIEIKGWAFVHNFDNYGYGSNKNLRVGFYFKSGETIIGFNKNSGDYKEGFEVEFQTEGEYYRDFTEAMRYAGSNYNSIYKNVGFTAKIPITSVELRENKWDLIIRADIKIKNGNTITKEESLAVEESVFSSVFSNDNGGKNFIVEVSGFKNTVKVIGNHVRYSGNTNYYWQLTSGYNYDPNKFVYLSSGSDKMRYYYLENSGSNSNPIPYGYGNGKCGFDSSYSKDSLAQLPCVGPGNKSFNRIRSVFVKPSGTVSIKFESNDNFCPSQNGNGVITDCNGFDKYRCESLMTVTAKEGEIEYKADVLPREEVSLELADDYSNITLGSGNGFYFGINYVDTVTFEIKDRHYDSLDKDNLIFKELLVNYYKYKVKYNEYYSNTNSFQDMLNGGGLVISDKFLNVDFSGDWECGDVSLNVKGNIGTIIQKCSFKLDNAYYNYSTGNIEYGNLKNVSRNDNIFMLTLGAYYISINSCINSYNNGRYEWKVTSGRNNLSTMKVKVSEDEIIDLSFSVDTLLEENNNSCFINFENNIYNCDDDGGPGSGPFDPGSNNKYKFVYRSISVNNPFPTGKIYDNWQNYYDKYKNFDRIHNSYDENNLEYKTKDLSIELLKDLKKFDYSYTEFDLSDIKKIVNSNFFKSIGTGCPFGEWEEMCDKR